MDKIRILIIGRLLAASVCFSVSGILAYSSIDGWGWFLFIGLLMGAITIEDGSG